MGLITAKDKELNRRFYYYPIIYDSAETARKYKLKDQKITFIFFQNGQEKNRFTFDSIKNPQKNFIPELNRLPMWNIKTSEN